MLRPLQLGAAMVADFHNGQLEFVTLDARQADAAALEGFCVDEAFRWRAPVIGHGFGRIVMTLAM